MSDDQILQHVAALDGEVRQIKDDIFRISWGMRGGVNSFDLFHTYSQEDRSIMNKIIKDNYELTKKIKMPMV